MKSIDARYFFSLDCPDSKSSVGYDMSYMLGVLLRIRDAVLAFNVL